MLMKKPSRHSKKKAVYTQVAYVEMACVVLFAAWCLSSNVGVFGLLMTYSVRCSALLVVLIFSSCTRGGFYSIYSDDAHVLISDANNNVDSYHLDTLGADTWMQDVAGAVDASLADAQTRDTNGASDQVTENDTEVSGDIWLDDVDNTRDVQNIGDVVRADAQGGDVQSLWGELRDRCDSVPMIDVQFMTSGSALEFNLYPEVWNLDYTTSFCGTAPDAVLRLKVLQSGLYNLSCGVSTQLQVYFSREHPNTCPPEPTVMSIALNCLGGGMNTTFQEDEIYFVFCLDPANGPSLFHFGRE
jgi:hypothetical protein